VYCTISTVSSRILKICWPRWPIKFLLNSSDLKRGFFLWLLRIIELTVEMVQYGCAVRQHQIGDHRNLDIVFNAYSAAHKNDKAHKYRQCHSLDDLTVMLSIFRLYLFTIIASSRWSVLATCAKSEQCADAMVAITVGSSYLLARY
jgi:hypothetical protein